LEVGMEKSWLIDLCDLVCMWKKKGRGEAELTPMLFVMSSRWMTNIVTKKRNTEKEVMCVGLFQRLLKLDVSTCIWNGTVLDLSHFTRVKIKTFRWESILSNVVARSNLDPDFSSPLPIILAFLNSRYESNYETGQLLVP
jgi:hypothetical protein